eukprot:3694233-Prymnesium_polylepis.1
MRAERSRFADNSASVSGAALQIDDGDVHLLNETILEGNTAPDDGGSIRLSSNSTLQYTLPAPPGHWLFIPQGDTFFLEQRVVTDSEFPYACPAGVVGGTTTREQSGPGCKERMLPGLEPCLSDSHPLIPTIGVPIAVRQLVRRAVCAQPERRIQALVHVGRIARAARRLASAAGCEICSAGKYCTLGTFEPVPCPAGRFGSEPGQTSRECSGLADEGHYCNEGSTSSTSGVCPAGTYNPETGGSSRAACLPCDAGRYALNGSAQCDFCAEGYAKPWANSSASKCQTCKAHRGVHCSTNSTTETMTAVLGWWRLSPYTSRTYQCVSKGKTSACVGGTYGERLCKTNHTGPKCQVCLVVNQYFDEDSAICQQCPQAGNSVAAASCIVVAIAIVAGALYMLHERRSRKYERFSAPLRRWWHATKSHCQAIGLIAKLKSVLAFVQVLATLENTYSIGLPESWMRWTRVLRFFGDIDWTHWVMPGDCIVGAGIVERLLLRALGPLAIVVAVPLASATVAITARCRASMKADTTRRRSRSS